MDCLAGGLAGILPGFKTNRQIVTSGIRHTIRSFHLRDRPKYSSCSAFHKLSEFQNCVKMCFLETECFFFVLFCLFLSFFFVCLLR